MLIYKIDNYEVHTKIYDRLNKVVNIRLNGDTKTGWIISNTTKQIDLLEMAINSIKRYEENLKASSIEELFG